MIIPVEDRWGLLFVFEQEYGVRKALQKLHSDGDLLFDSIPAKDQAAFLESTATPFVVQSFKQGKEFLKAAETASWLVKPLLLYYGMLCVVKGALVLWKADYFTRRNNLHHGITSPAAGFLTDFPGNFVSMTKEGVAPLCREALGEPPMDPSTQIAMHEILIRLPDIVHMYRLVFNRKEDYQFTVLPNVFFHDNKTGVFYIQFDLLQEPLNRLRAKLPTRLATDFSESTIDEGGQKLSRFVSKKTWPTREMAEAIGLPSFMAPLPALANGDVTFSFILPIERANGTLIEVSHIELIYWLVFHLSSLARYQPHLWLTMHSGSSDMVALVSRDVLATCENTFLFLLITRLRYAMGLPFIPPPDTTKTGNEALKTTG